MSCSEKHLQKSVGNFGRTGKKRSREIRIKQDHIGQGLERFVTRLG
ncbi:MAG: hypothetical protein LBF22_11895 [Deltaproteobacteria bacterium]|nr:hypothetical protein [Deltaproteobacteria bacterium]